MLLAIKVLTNSVSNRLEKIHNKAHTFTLQIKYNNFKTINRSKTIEQATNDSYQMYQIYKELFEEYYDDSFPVRLLGVSATKLIERKEDIRQLSIFDQFNDLEKDYKIKNLVNSINKFVGSESLQIGVSKDENKPTNTRKYNRDWADDIRKIQRK